MLTPFFFAQESSDCMELAEQTIAMINSQIKQDQAGAFKQWQAQTLPAMGDAYSADGFPFRSHLGASVIGKECPRELWYSFRWAQQKKFEGQLLRLFNRGHLEEGRFIAMLLAIGVQVYQQDEHGKQFRITGSCGHFGGSGDGFAIGLPEYPNERVLLEFKTSNDKKFNELKKHGCYEAKPEHFVQSNMYMGGMGFRKTLYMVVNKNTDELYGEFITANADLSDFYKTRADQIIFSETPPDRVRKSAGWIPCKWCDYKDICHNGDSMLANCRTCRHSAPSNQHNNGTWYCNLHNKTLDKHAQLAGCNNHMGIDDV